MKRSVCLLLVLTMLLSVVPALGVAAVEENVKAPAVQDFEDVSLGITADKWPGYKSHKAADIAPAPGKTDDRAIRLHDAQGEVIPEYLHGFESAGDLVVEFDFYPTDENPVSLRLLNGNAVYANTAFWLQLRNTGVWAYDGTYGKISEQTFIVNAWNHVRLEVITGAQAQAVVYINDVYAGTATKPSQIGSNTDTVDGFYFQTTNKTQDVYLDNLSVMPPYFAEGFEQLELNGSAAGMSGYKADLGGVVQENPADASQKSLALWDSANASWPYLHYTFDSLTEFTMELKLYTQQSNSFNIQLLNGNRSYANSAFWLQVRNNGVFAYDATESGSAGYVKVGDKGFTLNGWTHLRLEVTTGAEGKVDIYVNGEYTGTANKPAATVIGSNAPTVNGVYISAGQYKNIKFYLDDLKVQLPAEPLTFDNLGMSGSVEGLPGFVAQYGATVVGNPTVPGEKAMLLVDTTNASAPYYHAQVDDSNAMVLEFDLYMTEDNSLSVQLLNGARNEKNSAFWLQLRSTSVSSYDRKDDGTKGYVAVSAKGFTLGQWNKIRIRVTTGDQAEAVVYINGEYAGTAPKPDSTVVGSNAPTVNGAYIALGQYKNRPVYLDNLKLGSPVQLKDGILQLLEDDTVGTMLVDTDTTLDLGGHTLMVDNMICFGGVVDSVGSGKVLTDNMILSQLTSLPIYDAQLGGYRFFAYEMKNLGKRTNADGSQTYGFAVDFAQQQAYELLASGDCQVDFQVSLSWGEQEQTFAFSSALVQEYAALQLRYPNTQAALMLTITGLDTLAPGTKLSVTPILKAAGAAMAGVPMGDQPDSPSLPEELLEIQMGALFDIADNTEKQGLPADDPIVKEDFSASGGVYGYTQFPNAIYDPDTDRVYINYARHRDVVVDYPYDSTKVYDVDTLLNAQAGAQLQSKYVDMKTENTMFFTAMTKLRDGRMFAQNYVAYYLNNTTATTYSWIVDEAGNWTQIQGKLTLPSSLTLNGAQPGTTWYRYGFSRCLIELDDGTLLGSMYGSYGTILVQSNDLGKTWTYRSTIAESAIGLEKPYINTDGTDITWFEPAVTRCADGTLLCVMRTWRDKPMWQTRSYDNGLTWTEPTLLPGLDPAEGEGMSIYPQLLLLSNGVLALATGVPNDTVYFSLDGCGYNWDYGITTYDGDTTGNAGIAELGYDPKTDTVTLLALGDKGFQNESLAGVWGRIVTVKRNHAQAPQPDSAKASTERSEVGLGATVQARVEALFDTDGKVVQKDYTVRWYSLTPATATVDQNGLITAVGVGTAKIQALVTCGGQTVTTNEIQLQVLSRDTLANVEVALSKWVLKVGDSGTLTKVAYNACGQEIVTRVTKQEYFDGDPAKPKYYAGTVTWEFASRNSKVVTVNNQTGAFQAVGAGVTQIVAIAMKGNTKLTREITVIVESGNWVTQNFESSTLPTNCTANSLVSLSTTQAYSGSKSLYLNDNSASLMPTLRFEIPESKGVIVEFMLYVQSNNHSPSFGVGYPNAEGGYNYACNSAYVGLLYNPLTGAQGYQGYDGVAWSVNNRADIIPYRQWNKIRLEVTTDKPSRLYVNGSFVAEMPLAANNKLLNTIFFTSGGTNYTGDAFYVDDIRYMVFS